MNPDQFLFEEPATFDLETLPKVIGTDAEYPIMNVATADLRAWLARQAEAGVDIDYLVVRAALPNVFDWLLLAHPGFKQDRRHGVTLLEKALQQQAPLNRLRRLLPLVPRYNVLSWQSVVLSRLAKADRADAAALVMPFCSVEDIKRSGVYGWVKARKLRPGLRAQEVKEAVDRLEQAFEFAIETGETIRFQRLLRSSSPNWRSQPLIEKTWMGTAIARRSTKLQEVVFLYTDILQEEWRKMVDDGNVVWTDEPEPVESCDDDGDAQLFAVTLPPVEVANPLKVPLACRDDVSAFMKRAEVFDKDVYTRIKRVVGDAFDQRGYERELAPSVSPEAIAALAESFPLFAPLLEDLRAHLSLIWRVGEKTGEPQPLRLPNILIVGEPGWGKSYFIHRLSETLGLPFTPLSMSGMSAGFILSGSDPVWSTARPGMIHEVLTGGDVINPVILLDEIDKISSGDRYPADGPLYQLLEPGQARQFRDEYANYPIDASWINWFASANDLGRTHSAILSRFEVYEVPKASQEVARQTALSVYREGLRRSTWGTLFDPEPGDDVLDVMAAFSPREVLRLLMKACGRASLANRSTLQADDFGVRPSARRGIGFV